MIIQSPESPMPEPYKTYVRQRSETIASVLSAVITDRNIQLCPHAITPSEQVFDGQSDIVYGALVNNRDDGLKSVLYGGVLGKKKHGLSTSRAERAKEYAILQFQQGNRVRVKDPAESDGKGQVIAESIDELENAIHAMVTGDRGKVVVMPHLDRITQRISVGHIALGETGNYVYFGQEDAQVYEGEQVYGGTVLGLFRDADPGKSEHTLRLLDIPPDLAQLGIQALKGYQSIALSSGRVSVDVIEGFTDNGSLLRDVVDLTPRVGGTTPAEVLAIREIHTEGSGVCFAKSQLMYDPEQSPTTGVNFIDTDTLVINAEVLEVIT